MDTRRTEHYNKIGMGLVISHTYNLSHAYLSHTPHTVKHPTSVALSIGIHIAQCNSNVETSCYCLALIHDCVINFGEIKCVHCVTTCKYS